MGKITINSAIFPVIIKVGTGKLNSPNSSGSNMIDLPRGANLIYLDNLNNQTEIKLLEKYANQESFFDNDYETLLKLFITNITRLENVISDELQFFGVEILSSDEKTSFHLKDEYVPQTRVDTWECIALDLLRPLYTDIINCFDFGQINICLFAWRTEFDAIKQSLLKAFRIAFLFTLLGFLYGDDRISYNNFKDYFENEYYKRIALINGIWKTQGDQMEISYVPIFDNFNNLNGISAMALSRIINAVLDNKDIVFNERMMIKNRLIDGAKAFHKNTDPQSIALEKAIIKPVVNYIAEIQSAEDDLKAAKILLEEQLQSQSINRSYYSMMHALKALLEYNQLLSDWEPDELNVKENHYNLERRFIVLVGNNIIEEMFLTKFQHVKQKRWVADYNVSNFTNLECNECLKCASSFVNEVRKLTS